MRVRKSRTVSMAIERAPNAVYEYVLSPENLPAWATAFCRSIRKVGEEWIAETPDGPMTVEFVRPNELGVLDHYVSPAPGVQVFNPMRVVPNGDGSEVIFTLFQPPDIPDDRFVEDARMVERDLTNLKRILEGKPAP